MRSRDAAECCDSRSDSICPSLGASLRLCNWQNPPTITEPCPCFTVGVIQGRLLLFHLLFIAHRASHWTQRFRTLIHQSKGYYSIALLCSFCAPWPTRVFWLVLLPQLWCPESDIGQFQSSHNRCSCRAVKHPFSTLP